VKAIEREKQEEERSQGQNEENRHATRHQVLSKQMFTPH